MKHQGPEICKGKASVHGIKGTASVYGISGFGSQERSLLTMMLEAIAWAGCGVTHSSIVIMHIRIADPN
jgi:hypothetical protein